MRILNSFTRKKELFMPNARKTIKWYSCGPTVYDVSHLGHARCYITFDILRRILSNYFGYQVIYVMNITDIDDKIIKRARSNHLCDKFIESTLASDDNNKQTLIVQLKQMITDYQARRADEKDPAKLEMIANIIKASNQGLEQIETSQNRLTKDNLEQLRDVISDDQDIKFAHTVSDHGIFKSLTLRFEQEYHEDMQKLGVLPPSSLTRVSEFIDEVGAYLKKLEANGYAYRMGGSVYFDTDKFDADPKHSYAKLVREAFGQKTSLDEGEGELSLAQQDKKKSPNDFALWKKSKPGEPSWTTHDYEAGRPGWHIECSVMASNLLGENFDIHSGGCDLKFPHHDNEIAQAEAYYDSGKDWVNYFVHSGHLSISGCKMSKSLKNFITIRQALKDYTARQLRFAFLAHGWAETLDYSPNTMNTALSFEKSFNEFFLNVSDIFRRKFHKSQDPEGTTLRTCEQFKKWTDEDKRLNQEFIDTVNKVDLALCDNFDTRTTLNILSSLVKECNKRPEIDLTLLRDIAGYIENILDIFGTGFSDFRNKMSAMVNPQSGSSKDNANDEAVIKYVEALAQFRADIRKISRTKQEDKGDSIKQILALCDSLRDQTLPNLGVRLEDKEIDGNPFVVKLVDPETLARERALAEKMEHEKKLKEESARLEKLRLQQEREAKMKIPPNKLFIEQTDKYSKFDEKGIPTHDNEGKEITKSALKKLQKLYNDQETKYNKYLQEQKSIK